MVNVKQKALSSGTLTENEIRSLSDEDLMSLYSTMKRHADFMEHQVDFKHAMHLVRLIRMCEEALTTGQINVYRSDAQELLSIRDGSWAYDDLLSWAKEKEGLIQGKLYQESSAFPKKPNLHKCAEILMNSQRMAWEIMNE